MKGKLKNIILWSITAIIAISASIFGISNYTNVRADELIDGKELKDNGDGTYELSLSVTGESEKKVNKANVVVVLDISGSMNSATSYKLNNQGGYGKSGNDYFKLYYRTNGGWWSDYDYHEIDSTYDGVAYYVNGNQYSEYSGERYVIDETRLDAAKKAVNNLADSLLKNNTTENNDIIEIALVTFSTNAATSQAATTSYSTFSNTVNGLSADGGTNWEAALQQAKRVSFGADDKDTTYVIFVSDGNPTFHASNGGYGNYNNTYRVYGSGKEEEPNITRSYDQAKDDAKALVTDGYQFYTIGIYGNVDRMKDLTTYSGVSVTDNYFSAEDTAKLQSALNTILQKIETAGIGEATIEDGTTQFVETESGNLNLLTIDYTDESNNSFRYWLSFPVTKNEDGSYSAKLNNKDAKVLANSDGSYTCTWGDNNEFSLNGTVQNNTFKYEWVGANDLYNKPAPKATLKDSKVNWDLKDLDVLLNGVTYTVTFNVWPSQETYDLISDLDNGIKKYDKLDKSITDVLVDNGNGYTLLTNTKATLTYTDTRNNDGKQTATYKNPDPVTTGVSKMEVVKSWDNDLDEHDNEVTKVELNVLKGTSKYGKTITLTGDKDWKEEVFISTGLMSVIRDKDNNIVSAIVREKGHDYTFEEIEDGTYYWDLDVETVRPMLINENDEMVLKTFVKVTENAPVIGNSNVTVVDGVTYFKIDGSVYYIREENRATLKATNIRRSNLNITKSVTGSSAPEDTLFEFDLTVNDINNNDVWFSIYDPKNGTVKDDKYVSAEDLFKENDDNGNFNGYYSVKSGTKVTVKMQANWNLRFTNLPTGSTYTFEEKTMPEDFAFVKAEATDVSARVDLLPNGATDNGDGSYTVNGVKYTKVTENGKIYYTYTGAANINDKVVSGKIFVGNTSYTVKFTNDYLKTEVNGTKVWEDNKDQDGIRPENITIKLIAKVDGQEVTDLGDTQEVSGTGERWNFSFKDLTRYYNGKEVEYSIDEVKVDNYETTKEIDKDGNYIITNTHEPEKITISGTKTWVDEDDSNRPKEISITLTGKVGEDTLVTKNEKVSAKEDGTWSYSFTGLDKYKVGAVGEEIIYTISEDALTEYDSKVEGYNVTNTLKTKEVTVTKEWKDDIDKSNRPTEITVELYAGDKLYKTAVLNDKNEWTYKFTDLPMYKNHEEVKYSVKEVNVTGYKSEVSGNEKDGFKITNTLITTNVSGTKSWDDSDNQDGKRPTEVIIDLLADGNVIANTKATKDGEWKYSFTNLPKFISGKEVTYSVKERATTGYTASYDGFNIKNTHTVEKTQVNTTKVWDDKNNQDGKRPTSITINLLADGTKVSSCTTNSEKGWACSFTGLDKYKDGKEISYTITEEEVPGYTTKVEGYTITNSYDPAKTQVSVSKVWNDNKNQDGKRPASVTINLFANDTKVDNITLSEENNWAYTFTGLDKFASGSEIKYTVSEEKTSVITGKDAAGTYAYSITGNASSGYVITNTHTPEITSVIGKKSWVDSENIEGLRPTEITVRLMVGEKEIANNTVKEGSDGEWTYSFTNLPKYENGKEIEYTVKEDAVDKYETSYDKKNPYIIVNTHSPKNITMSVKKVWEDTSVDGVKNIYGHNESIEVRLVGKVGETVYINETTTLDKDNEWMHTFTDLPEYREGKLISYSFEEITDVKNYSVKLTNNGNDYTFTNTYSPKTTTISGVKTWVDEEDNDDIRPDSIELTLTDNYNNVIATKTVTSEDEWTYSFENLPVYDSTGEKLVYTLTETDVDGYTSKIEDYNVTNTHEVETVSFNITKVWNDNDNNDGIRPDSITVRLLGDGVEVDKATIGEEDGWTYTFTANKYANGKAIEYTIVEDEVDGYTKEISKVDDNNFKVVNTHANETTEITITKTWDDMDDISEIRPDSITVYIYADSEEYKTITISKDDNWVKTISDLPKYNNGKAIEYTIGEKEVFEYETIIDGFNITNKHELGKGNGPSEEPEILPPQTGVYDNRNNSIIYIVLIIFSLLNINVMFLKNN